MVLVDDLVGVSLPALFIQGCLSPGSSCITQVLSVPSDLFQWSSDGKGFTNDSPEVVSPEVVSPEVVFPEVLLRSCLLSSCLLRSLWVVMERYGALVKSRSVGSKTGVAKQPQSYHDTEYGVLQVVLFF